MEINGWKSHFDIYVVNQAAACVSARTCVPRDCVRACARSVRACDWSCEAAHNARSTDYTALLYSRNVYESLPPLVRCSVAIWESDARE